jgi:hypothetical protein
MSVKFRINAAAPQLKVDVTDWTHNCQIAFHRFSLLKCV